MFTGRTVLNHSRVAIGIVDEHGDVYDHAGVHMGTAGDDGVVRDFAGVRIGTVEGARASVPAGATR